VSPEVPEIPTSIPHIPRSPCRHPHATRVLKSPGARPPPPSAFPSHSHFLSLAFALSLSLSLSLFRSSRMAARSRDQRPELRFPMRTTRSSRRNRRTRDVPFPLHIVSRLEQAWIQSRWNGERRRSSHRSENMSPKYPRLTRRSRIDPIKRYPS